MQKEVSPQLYRYLKKFQQDPTSRVFAPLAEAYRKAGLVDEAIDIAREGLMVHPHFVSGRVALARALFDKKLYKEVIETLLAVIEDVPDNFVAQKLMGESYLVLGEISQALSSYKMILYFNPHDKEVAKIVRELEEQVYQNEALVIRDRDLEEEGELYQIQSATNVLGEDPDVLKKDWVGKVEILQELLQKVRDYRWKRGKDTFPN